MKHLALSLACLLSVTAQAQVMVGGGNDDYTSGDTANVEHFDDQRLQPLVGSLETVPFFHSSRDAVWYVWNAPGESHHYRLWERGRGVQTVDSVDHFDDKPFPKINPYGTSPDSLWRLAVDSLHNLTLEDLRSHAVHQLSTDGAEGWEWNITDVVWLTGGRFVIQRDDHRGVRRFALLYGGFMPPSAADYEYEIPGDTIVKTTSVYVGHATEARLQQVDVNRWPCQQLVTQQVEGQFGQTLTDRVYFWRNRRTRNEAELITIDGDGRLLVLITEKSLPRINPDMFQCKITSDGRDIFLWSDRTGWGHLYHYNGEGRLLNAVTTGAWTAGRIVTIDEKKRQIYFCGYGREKGRNPNYQFYYRADYNGRHLRLLTPEDANHDVHVGRPHNLVFDCYSRVDLPPHVVLRDGDGRLLQRLDTADVSRLKAYGWREPEMFTVKAADDSTVLYGVMWKPFDFNPNKKYPIISQVYPGPFTETVPQSYCVYHRYHNSGLAQRGFIVVCVGHRGSAPWRSKAYNVYGYGRLRDYALADDSVAIKQLARRFAFIDSTRVGIVGHSGGAMMAAAALMTYPGLYKAAVASSGNYDNRIYNRFWGETYQGISDDKAPFDVATVQQLVPRMRGRLLLCTGDADQNVHPEHTRRLVEALIEANKDFDLLVLPGQSHHYDHRHQMYFERRKRDFFERTLK